MNYLFSISLNQQRTCCCICGNPVALEMSKTDEQGVAVHEECYVGRTVALLAAEQQTRQRSRMSAAGLHLEEINALEALSRLF